MTLAPIISSGGSVLGAACRQLGKEPCQAASAAHLAGSRGAAYYIELGTLGMALRSRLAGQGWRAGQCGQNLQVRRSSRRRRGRLPVAVAGIIGKHEEAARPPTARRTWQGCFWGEVGGGNAAGNPRRGKGAGRARGAPVHQRGCAARHAWRVPKAGGNIQTELSTCIRHNCLAGAGGQGIWHCGTRPRFFLRAPH